MSTIANILNVDQLGMCVSRSDFEDKLFTRLVHFLNKGCIVLKIVKGRRVAFFSILDLWVVPLCVIEANLEHPRPNVNHLNTQSKNLPFGRRFKLFQNHRI